MSATWAWYAPGEYWWAEVGVYLPNIPVNRRPREDPHSVLPAGAVEVDLWIMSTPGGETDAVPDPPVGKETWLTATYDTGGSTTSFVNTFSEGAPIPAVYRVYVQWWGSSAEPTVTPESQVPSNYAMEGTAERRAYGKGLLEDPIVLVNGSHDLRLADFSSAPGVNVTPPEIHVGIATEPVYWCQLGVGTMTEIRTTGSFLDAYFEIWIGDPTDPEGMTFIGSHDDDDAGNPVWTDNEQGVTHYLRVGRFGTAPDDSLLHYDIQVTDEIVGGDGGGDPDPDPDPGGIPALPPLGTRWRFWDALDGTSYVMPINPNSMSSPELGQNTSTGVVSPIDGRTRSTRTRRQPREFSFGGVIRTKQHHDDLLEWSKKSTKIYVSDHRGLQYEIRFISFDVEERKPTPLVSWRLRYTMKCLTYGRAMP